MNRSEQDRPGKAQLALSLALHGTVFLLIWAVGFIRPEPQLYEIIDIEIVSPPAALPLEEAPPEPEPPPPEELEVETPEPEPEEVPPPIEEERPQEVVSDPEPTPDPPPEDPPEEEPEPTRTEDPDPEVEDPGEDIEVRMEGLQRDFPEYYANIVRWMTRCLRSSWTQGGNWSAVVDFRIISDGTVPGSTIDLHQRSGHRPFDFASIEAVECAGERFDPLPEGMNIESLPVRFRIDPAGGGGQHSVEKPEVRSY